MDDNLFFVAHVSITVGYSANAQLWIVFDTLFFKARSLLVLGYIDFHNKTEHYLKII